jgi:pyrroloquinoline quinone (PQQ) biosynthesis protein C
MDAPVRQALPIPEFVDELNAALDDPVRDRTNHPFVLAVENGTASKDQIAGWLNQFSLWADPTNKLFGVQWAKCPDDDLREGILENMLEEEYGESSKTSGHMKLLESTIRELGWSDERRAQDDMKLESWLFKHWAEVVIRNRSFVEGLAATSFAAERINPLVFAKMEKGLRAHYDLSEDAMISVAVHASDVEEEHGSLGPVAMERYATTTQMQEAVRFAVIHTADLYYNQYNIWKYY